MILAARYGDNCAFNWVLLRFDPYLLFDAGFTTRNPDDLTIEIIPTLRNTKYREFHGVTRCLSVDEALQLSRTRICVTGYMHEQRKTGAASPLWGLQVVERTSETGDEPPLLIDPQRLGVIFTGVMAVLTNPYVKADRNLTDVRLEMSALAHTRRPDAAYVIAEPEE